MTIACEGSAQQVLIPENWRHDQSYSTANRYLPPPYSTLTSTIRGQIVILSRGLMACVLGSNICDRGITEPSNDRKNRLSAAHELPPAFACLKYARERDVHHSSLHSWAGRRIDPHRDWSSARL